MSLTNLASIRASLGQPYYEDENVLLYHGDCVELLDRLPEGKIDLTVTSPPYNIGKEYESLRTFESYVSWCEKWMRQIFIATKPFGAFWLNAGYFEVPDKGLAVPIVYYLWDKSPFYLIQEIVWNYGAGVACRNRLSPRNEKLLWYVKGQAGYTFNLDDIRDPDVKYPNQKKNGKLKCNPLGKNPSDVWQIAKVTSGSNRASPERTAHPAQSPVDLISRAVLASSNPGAIVLDPFMGSGSTAEVALRTGRRAIGFETDERYLELSVNRLERYKHQRKMTEAQSELALNVQRFELG